MLAITGLRNCKLVLSLACLVMVLGWAAGAAAQDRRVGIHIVGKGDALVRNRVGEVLATNGCKLTSHQQVEAAARSLKKGFDSNADLAAIARKLKVGALVIGEVNAPAGKARIVVHGSNGATVADASYSVKGGPDKLGDAIASTLWSKIGSGLQNARPAAAEPVAKKERRGADNGKPAPDEAEEEEEEEPAPSAAEERPARAEPEKRSRREEVAKNDDREERAERSPTVRKKAKRAKRASEDDDEAGEGSGFPALALDIGPRLMSRNLGYSKNFGTALLPFVVNNRAAMGFSAVWYPMAHTQSGFASNVGVVVNGEYAATFVSKSPDNLGYPTKASDYFGGLRVRAPLGTWLEPSATVGYGRHAFVFLSGPGAPRNGINVPDVDYSYLRGGANMRLQLPAGVTVLAGAGYRAVLGSGKQTYQIQSAQYFPRATTVGLDALVAVAYRVHPLVEVRGGWDLRRYVFTTHANASDAIPLSGFVDQYSAFWVNLALVVDGMGGGSRAPAGTASAEDDEE